MLNIGGGGGGGGASAEGTRLVGGMGEIMLPQSIGLVFQRS